MDQMALDRAERKRKQEDEKRKRKFEQTRKSPDIQSNYDNHAASTHQSPNEQPNDQVPTGQHDDDDLQMEPIDPSEQWESSDSSVTARQNPEISFKLRPYLLEGKYEDSDKIILHANILEKLQKENLLQFPLLFKCMHANKFTHCGVAEFSADQPETIGLPKKVWQNIAEPGNTNPFGEVIISSVKLPKCKSVTLLADSSKVFTENIQVLLESWLRSHFTALTLGDMFDVRGITFYVQAIEPSPAACLIDTDVDLILEIGTSNEHEQAKVLRISEEIKLFESVDKPQPITQFRVFVPDNLKTSEIQNTLVVSVEHVSGFVEIFAAFAPVEVSEINFDFVSDLETDGRAELSIPLPADRKDQVLLIGVKSTNNVERLKISCAFANNAETSHIQATESALVSSSTTEQSPTQECENCKKHILVENYQMHTMMCHRLLFRCEKCSRVLRKEERGKHTHCDLCGKGFSNVDICNAHVNAWHREIKCECGETILDRTKLLEHKSTSCTKRLVVCKFCGLATEVGDLSKMDAKDRFEGIKSLHEAACGNRTETCDICKRRIRLKDFDVHNMYTHSAEYAGLGLYDHDTTSAELPRLEPCPFCGEAKFSSPEDWESHVQSH